MIYLLNQQEIRAPQHGEQAQNSITLFGGVDTLTNERREASAPVFSLGYRSCRLTPTLMRGSSKPPMRRTADQMPLNIECVVDRGMDGNEALSRFGRFEALHLSFSSSNRLMRVLRTVVGTQSLLMQSRKANLAKRRSVGPQLIGDDNRRNEALATKELAQKAHCRGLVASGRNKNFQNLALTIDSAPQVHLLSRE